MSGALAQRCGASPGVRPAARAQGVGTALLSYLERRAHALGPGLTITVTQWATDTAAPALLRERGYAETRYVLRMQSRLDGHVPGDAPVPAGVQIDEYHPDGDAARLFAAWQEAFADESVTEGRWWHERRDDPTVRFDPSLWLVARHGEEIVGCCLARVRDDRDHGTVGYVGDIGVRPAWRGLGIAYALLTRMLTVFASRGPPVATLDVDADNLTGALRLYRKAGMRPEPNFTIWSKPLG
jgi:mycothiol synthase